MRSSPIRIILLAVLGLAAIAWAGQAGASPGKPKRSIHDLDLMVTYSDLVIRGTILSFDAVAIPEKELGTGSSPGRYPTR